MDKREVLTKLYTVKLKNRLEIEKWYGILADEVLDTIYKQEVRLEHIIYEMLGLDKFMLNPHWFRLYW